jgi:hypothetical protein
MKYLFCALVLSAATLLGGDVTGRWTGTIAFESDSAVPTKANVSQSRTGVWKRIASYSLWSPVRDTALRNGDDHLVGGGEKGENKFSAKLDLKRVK